MKRRGVGESSARTSESPITEGKSGSMAAPAALNMNLRRFHIGFGIGSSSLRLDPVQSECG